MASAIHADTLPVPDDLDHDSSRAHLLFSLGGISFGLETGLAILDGEIVGAAPKVVRRAIDRAIDKLHQTRFELD